MSLVKLQEVKQSLQITDSSQDAYLQNVAIPSAEGIVKGVIGDVSTSDKTETINCSDVGYRYDGQFITLSNINITAVKTINGTVYSGALKILPPHKRRIRVQDLSTYLTVGDPYFDIVYTAGYSADNMTDDIKHVVYTIISMLRSQESGRPVKIYKVGDVSVHFADDQETSGMITNINSILSKYKTFSL